MATQRVVLLKVIGTAGRMIADQCRAWAERQRIAPDDMELSKEIGRFVEMLDTHRTELPVVYYSEWLDRWSMGDDFARPFTPRAGVELKMGGPFHEAFCTDRPAEMLTLPTEGWQWDEQTWLAVRLREAAVAWEKLIPDGTLVFLRQVITASTLDEEITASAQIVPDWLRGELPDTD